MSAASSGQGARAPRDADATRRALLRSAQRRFVLLGYDRTTTRDIAADAGVNLALINRYFGGKEGLYRTVLESAPELLAEVGDDSAAGGDLVEQFLEGLHPGAWPDLGAHPLLLLMRNAGAGEEAETLRSVAVRGAISRIIQAGAGGPSPEDDAARRDLELRAQLVHALLSGVVAMREMTPLEPLASATEDELEPLLRDAIDALLGPARPADAG